MDKQSILLALKEAKKNSKQRKFTQRVEAIINLKDLNLKKPEETVDIYVELPHTLGSLTKICGLVGGELKEQAKKVLDTSIEQGEFAHYQDNKKAIKKLAQEHRFFIAQANVMPAVAKTFGRILGQQGKLPSPKAGAVVAPNADLSVVKDKLSRTIRATAKTELSIKAPVGRDDQEDEQVAENILTLYNRVKAVLPKEEHNIKNLMIKTTMGKPTVVAK